MFKTFRLHLTSRLWRANHKYRAPKIIVHPVIIKILVHTFFHLSPFAFALTSYFPLPIPIINDKLCIQFIYGVQHALI